ncbi:hypothetical protein OIV83_000269 [Microbotryomycetes sp. JL201]|nr:hypothetical protein OIV83_000269 [Microbotryomycetes sp. JL201]
MRARWLDRAFVPRYGRPSLDLPARPDWKRGVISAHKATGTMIATQTPMNSHTNQKKRVLRHHKPRTPRQPEYLPLPGHLAKLIIQSFLIPSTSRRNASSRHLRPYRRSPLVLSTYDNAFVQEVRQVESRMPVPSMRYVSRQTMRGRSETRSFRDSPGLGLRGIEFGGLDTAGTRMAMEEMAMRCTEAKLWEKLQRARIGDKMGLTPGRELRLWAMINRLRVHGEQMNASEDRRVMLD